jgi:sulfatase maturation enzyme AslB (radical SAM superfamily)
MQLMDAFRKIIPGLRSGRLRMVFYNIPNNISRVAHLRTPRDLYNWFYFKFPYAFEVPDFPPYINLSITERCNRSCVHCLRNRKPQGTHDMELPMFRRIVDEIAQHPECLLKIGGQSEPAVHPQIWDFVSLLAERKVKWAIYTNGTLFERFSPKEMIELGFRYLIVSIDGIDAQSYESIRVGSNYSTLKSNVINFHLARKELKSRLPRIEIRHVIFPNESGKNLRQFKHDWLEFADTVEFNSLNPLIPQHRDASAPLFRRCRDIRRQFHINAWGRVDICGTSETLGDLNISTIKELWGAPILQFMRSCHERYALEDVPLCRNCHQITS